MRKVLLVVGHPNKAFHIIAQDIVKFGQEFEYTIALGGIGAYLPHTLDIDSFDIIYYFGTQYHINEVDDVKKAVRGCHSYLDVGRIKTPAKMKAPVNKLFLEHTVIKNDIKKVPYNVLSAGIDTDYFRPRKVKPHNGFVIGWVGTKSTGAKQYNIAEELGKFDGISLAGRFVEKPIPHYEMPDFYNNIDCLICTAKCEGHPLPVLEAAACGKPIISTAVGIVPELAEQSEGIIIVSEPDEKLFIKEPKVENFITAINKLKNNPDLCKSMGDSNVEAIRKYWDWKIRIKDWENAFKKI